MKKYLKYIYLILYIITITFIFYYALRNASQSTSDAGRVTNIILSILKIINLEDKINVESLTVIVRKLIGHFGIFFICGFFGIKTYINFIKNKKTSIKINLLAGLLIAIISELLQLIPIGRSCQITDMIIDYSGYLIICIMYIIINKKSFQE